MLRNITLFESKTILDYNKAGHLNSLRYNCVRAKELDDNQGSAQDGTFFLSMLEVSNAIRQELGLAVATKLLAESSEEPEELEALRKEIVELNEELDEMDETITKQTEEIESTNKDLEAMSGKNTELNKRIEALIEQTKTTAKAHKAALAKAKKGAK